MKNFSSFLFLLVLLLGAQFVQGDDQPQVFLPLQHNKKERAVSGLPDANSTSTQLHQPVLKQTNNESSLNVLLIRKITELQEALQHNQGKLEVIQHQTAELKKSFEELKKTSLLCPKALSYTDASEQTSSATSPYQGSKTLKEADAAAAPTASPDLTVPGHSVIAASQGDTKKEASSKKLTAEESYKEIHLLLLESNYGKARQQLIKFLESFKTHTLIPAAYYWLGETHFAEKNYEEAAKVFLKGYQNNQSSSKAEDLLLKLGLSLASLDKKEEACKTFSKLRSVSKKLSPTHKHILEKEEKKLNCGH